MSSVPRLNERVSPDPADGPIIGMTSGQEDVRYAFSDQR
jgi:hypothetical protein